MNAQAAYLIVSMRMHEFQSEAEHIRLAREASRERRSALRRIASNIRRTLAGVDESLVPPALPALTDYPYRS